MLFYECLIVQKILKLLCLILKYCKQLVRFFLFVSIDFLIHFRVTDVWHRFDLNETLEQLIEICL